MKVFSYCVGSHHTCRPPRWPCEHENAVCPPVWWHQSGYSCCGGGWSWAGHRLHDVWIECSHLQSWPFCQDLSRGRKKINVIKFVHHGWLLKWSTAKWKASERGAHTVGWVEKQQCGNTGTTISITRPYFQKNKSSYITSLLNNNIHNANWFFIWAITLLYSGAQGKLKKPQKNPSTTSQN